MSRLCERPGCSELGEVAYGFDVDRTLVWLAAPEPDVDRVRCGVFCRRHADSMVVPLGWSLDDRRDPRPKLFRPPREPRRPRPPRRRRSVPPQHEDAELPLDPPRGQRTVAAITGVGSVTTVDPAAIVATLWMPAFDLDDDLNGVLDAESPLLGRAFQGVPRR